MASINRNSVTFRYFIHRYSTLVLKEQNFHVVCSDQSMLPILSQLGQSNIYSCCHFKYSLIRFALYFCTYRLLHDLKMQHIVDMQNKLETELFYMFFTSSTCPKCFSLLSFDCFYLSFNTMFRLIHGCKCYKTYF